MLVIGRDDYEFTAVAISTAGNMQTMGIRGLTRAGVHKKEEEMRSNLDRGTNPLCGGSNAICMQIQNLNASATVACPCRVSRFAL